jgi:hypothetical protein
VTGHVERFSGNSDGDGKYEHRWGISGNAKTGIFQVKVDASASGYGTASGSSGFRVIGASQTGLLSQPDPCLDNSTLTDCQPDPCDLPNPSPECPAPPTICSDGSTVLPGEPCPKPPAPPTICPDGSTVLPGEPCPEEPEDPVIIIDDPPVSEDEEEEEDEADEETVEEESDDESSSEDEDSNFGG